MSRWFRMYGEAVNDPKVQRLPAETFKTWVNLLCIASMTENGDLPPIPDIAFTLRKPESKIVALIEELESKGLLDETDTGWKPHAWDDRQYKSDVSTERVKRFRKRFRSVSETPPDTDTDTDTEKPPIVPLSGGRPSRRIKCLRGAGHPAICHEDGCRYE